MVDHSKYRQVKIVIILPDGTKTTIYRYIDVTTNNVVDESVLKGETVETITISCTNICAIE